MTVMTNPAFICGRAVPWRSRMAWRRFLRHLDDWMTQALRSVLLAVMTHVEESVTPRQAVVLVLNP